MPHVRADAQTPLRAAAAWTVAHIRAAEDAVLARTGEQPLMRRAAFGVATRGARMLGERARGVAGRRVVLLVGPGNNGGDALWAGALLARRGAGVHAVLLAPDRTHAGGLAALRSAGGRTSTELPARADLVVDGIVGLAARGPLRPGAAALVDRVDRELSAPILAVDLPSGVEPDTGAVDGPAVTAAATVTFGAHKPVHVLNPTRCGPTELVDIGLGPELGAPDLTVPDPADVGARWPVPGTDSTKYTQGVTGVAAGSADYPGAAVLTTSGAVLATSGMVRFAGTAADAVRTRWPEVIGTGSVTDAGRVQAWAVGPGIGTGNAGRDLLARVLSEGVPVCADADATTLLAAHPELADARNPATPLVLTPHDREFARLTGAEPGADRVAAARRAAHRFDAVLLLKGHSTIVAAPDGRAWVNPARSAWAATAGSGDVLTGMIAALLAAGLEPDAAAAFAAHAHELAADLAAAGGGQARAGGGAHGGPGATAPASHLAEAIPAAVRSLRGAAAAPSTSWTMPP